MLCDSASICVLFPVLKTTHCHVMLIKKYIFWPKNAKTGNITLGKFPIRKNWCGQSWWFWIFYGTFWLAWQFFQQACFIRLSLAFPGLISITKQIMHMNTRNKIFLHENGDHLAFFKNTNLIVLCSKQRKCQKSLYLKNDDFTLNVFFYMLICSKAVDKTLLRVSSKNRESKK